MDAVRLYLATENTHDPGLKSLDAVSLYLATGNTRDPGLKSLDASTLHSATCGSTRHRQKIPWNLHTEVNNQSCVYMSTTTCEFHRSNSAVSKNTQVLSVVLYPAFSELSVETVMNSHPDCENLNVQ